MTFRYCKYVLFRTSLIIFIPTCISLQAQEQPSTGPVVEKFGPVYEVPDLGLPAPADRIYKVVFDIDNSPSDHEKVNSALTTVARFLNMHARAGVPAQNLQVAIVMHGSASKDALTNSAYRKRYGGDNPNAELLQALERAGVRAYLCGQTATYREIHTDELTPPVQMALSAMTALVLLQEDGYNLIPW
jgi:intracellular sulfur oxidation DsrE/DsrF family protein